MLREYNEQHWADSNSLWLQADGSIPCGGSRQLEPNGYTISRALAIIVEEHFVFWLEVHIEYCKVCLGMHMHTCTQAKWCKQQQQQQKNRTIIRANNDDLFVDTVR